MGSSPETNGGGTMRFGPRFSADIRVGDRLKNSVGKTNAELSRLAQEFAEEVISDKQSAFMQQLRMSLALAYCEKVRSLEKGGVNDQFRIVRGLIKQFVETKD